MQTRSLSTKKSEEQTAHHHNNNNNNNNINKRGEEQNLKETSSTSSSTGKAPGEPEPEEGKPNKTQQLKKVFKEYGAVGVSFHIGISLMSLGMFYLLISSGIDMAAVLCKVGFSEAVVRSKMAAGTSTFVLAYAIHKLFAPPRISITLVSVPLIVRYFRKTGHFKPPTPAP
uniref:C20orf108 n=1 Tax=Anoplopoma fimbria TaxID=229290 RepID=C3KI08_ANOFI|nr:C20orf108 [Anoplopoma fimbria]